MTSLTYRIGLLIFVVLIFSCVASSQTRKITVGITVSADERIKSQIESYIKSELRQIGDIDIYASDPEFEVRIVAIDPGSAVVLSVVVVSKADFTPYIEWKLSGSNVTSQAKKDLTELLAKQDSIMHHAVMSRSEAMLRDLCRDVVASIDTDVFEESRKTSALIDRAINREKPASASRATEQPQKTTKPVTSGTPVFEKEYLGGDSVSIVVKNDTDRILTLSFGGVRYILQPQMSKEIVAEGGRYEFAATAPSARPKTGVEEFAKGYRYTWRFFIVRR